MADRLPIFQFDTKTLVFDDPVLILELEPIEFVPTTFTKIVAYLGQRDNPNSGTMSIPVRLVANESKADALVVFEEKTYYVKKTFMGTIKFSDGREEELLLTDTI